MVAAQRDELRVAGADAGRLGCLVDDLAGAQLEEGFVHLSLGEPVVEGRDGDVAAVGDLGPGLVRVDPCARVVACSGHLACAGGADGAWTEAGSCGVGVRFGVWDVCAGGGGSWECGRTWSVADGCVEWCADNGNVIVLIGLNQTSDWLQVGEAGNAGEGPLD